MGGVAKVGNLVAHARLERECAAVTQFGVELAFQHVEHVAPVAPVIGQIARCVLHYPNTQVANIQGAPESLAALTGMNRGGDLTPVRDGEGQRWYFHSVKSQVVFSRPSLFCSRPSLVVRDQVLLFTIVSILAVANNNC